MQILSFVTDNNASWIRRRMKWWLQLFHNQISISPKVWDQAGIELATPGLQICYQLPYGVAYIANDMEKGQIATRGANWQRRMPMPADSQIYIEKRQGMLFRVKKTLTAYTMLLRPSIEYASSVFVWFDSLRPINNLSVKQGRVFLGWTSTKLG